ncbi:hypothetical protein SCOR_11340 [Sulfidibacter corallicola]
MIAPMNEKRLADLIRMIQRGELSRNRHFEAYKDPTVRQAKRAHLRLQAIYRLVDQYGGDRLDVEVRQEGELHHLTFHAPQWNFTWAAFLRPFEYAVLRDHVAFRELLDHSLVPEPAPV